MFKQNIEFLIPHSIRLSIVRTSRQRKLVELDCPPIQALLCREMFRNDATTSQAKWRVCERSDLLPIGATLPCSPPLGSHDEFTHEEDDKSSPLVRACDAAAFVFRFLLASPLSIIIVNTPLNSIKHHRRTCAKSSRFIDHDYSAFRQLDTAPFPRDNGLINLLPF